MGYLLAIIILIIYAAFMRSFYEIHTIEINKINILHEHASDRQPVFIFFADLHGVTFGDNNAKLLKKIDSINPDAIIIGGDMIVEKKNKFIGDSNEKLAAIELINTLCKRYTVFYAFGNHEARAREKKHLRAEFKNYTYRIENKNLHILSNSHEYVTFKGTRFCIYGLDIDTSYYSKKRIQIPDVNYIKACLGDSPEHKHSIPIVISHNPDTFDACAEWGAEYVLSGHNHGGYIRIPFLGGFISSNYRLFPKYSSGIYKNNAYNSTMLLTKGLGTHTIKFRLFNKPELMVITFKPSPTERS